MWTRPALLLTLAFPVSFAPSASAVPPSPALAFPDGSAGLGGDEAATLGALWAHGCRVMTPSAGVREVLAGATARVAEALADARVSALLTHKADWMTPVDGAFVANADRGAALLAGFGALAGARTVSVFTFEDSAEHPCRGPVAANVNAFTPIGAPVIVFRKSYLEGLAAASDREAASRRLTRTLAHELAHVLGYVHHDEAAFIGTSSYNNTVPVYLGCVAASWPDVDFAAAHCGESDWLKPSVPLAEK